MSLNKINISSNTSLNFKDLPLFELLDLFNVKYESFIPEIYVATTTNVNIPLTKLSELKTLFEKKIFSEEFGNLIIESDSTFSTPIENINSFLDEIFSKNKIDYVKKVELVSAEKTEITFKINTKIGISFPLVLELPLTLDRFLIFNMKIKNGVKVLLKIINTILKVSSNKSIIEENNTVRVNIRELFDISPSFLYVIDNWIDYLNGKTIVKNNIMEFDLSFKLNKPSSEKLVLKN